MEDEPMGGRFLVPLLVPFVRCYWVAACLFYCLKFWSPKVDALTSYGKLAKTTGTAATRSASDRLFALLRAPVVTHKLGWTSFYVFGFLWNLLFHWAFVYRLGWDGEATQPSFRHRWLIGALFGLHLIKRIFECLFVHAFSHRYMTLLNFVAGASLSSLCSLFTACLLACFSSSSSLCTRLTIRLSRAFVLLHGAS
ncbi:Very-long-chain enoyl-CoA reductase, variant 2 [Balamuthia mandrillaris]